jgi:DNA-directed RNA polymerase specialized sigma24 family protein
VSNQRTDFAEFYRQSRNDCLRAVLVNVGDQDTAQDLVAEAFARAWASWRTVSKHPAPAAWVVRTALNAGVSRWRWRRRAEVLGIAPGTVTAHLARAIAALRHDLMPVLPQETSS